MILESSMVQLSEKILKFRMVLRYSVIKLSEITLRSLSAPI